MGFLRPDRRARRWFSNPLWSLAQQAHVNEDPKFWEEGAVPCVGSPRQATCAPEPEPPLEFLQKWKAQNFFSKKWEAG